MADAFRAATQPKRRSTLAAVDAASTDFPPLRTRGARLMRLPFSVEVILDQIRNRYLFHERIIGLDQKRSGSPDTRAHEKIGSDR
jgi:hypothetical protein